MPYFPRATESTPDAYAAKLTRSGTYLPLLAFATLLACQRNSLPEVEVPGYARESFAKAYPSATKVEWERVDAGYEAEWKMDGTEYGATYTSSGTLVETEREFENRDIANFLVDAVRRDYGEKAEIEEAAEITRGDEKSYEVEVEVGKKEFAVRYTMDGRKLSEELADED